MTDVTHGTHGAYEAPKTPARRHGPTAGWTCRGSAAALALSLVAGSVMGIVVTAAGAPGVAHAGQVTETYATPKGRDFRLSGLGYGHGIGMSQFGAEGMGRLGKSYRQIVKFYFPGTSFGQTKSGRQITVGLSGVTKSTPQGTAVVVVKRPGLIASNRGDSISLPTRVGGARVTNYRVVRGSGGLAVYAVSSARAEKVKGGLSGAVTWRTDPAIADSKVAVSSAAGGTRLYRGFMDVKKGSTSVLSVSRLRLEDYLRSVVSHEVPSSWTPAALRAQAVAARSYALLSQVNARAAHRPYDICDSTSCQAYGPIGGESGAEGRAVRATRGVFLKSGGQPVLAMYSSANGGYSVAGGRPYLVAKRDPYDGVVTGTANWGHQWSTKVSAGSIERAWPQIGRLQKVKVLGRDGNGQWGGRVMSVGLVGSKSTVTVSADSFRWAVGLKSTWWTITNADSGAAAPAKKVRVTRGDRTALVRWGAPDSERRVTGYRITVTNSKDVYRVGRAARKVRVKDLTNGREYRAKVAPVYRSGAGPQTATPAFVPTSPFSYFQPMAARQLLDRGQTAATRSGEHIAVSVIGKRRAPAAGTRAVVVRVLAESGRQSGRVKVWPCGAPKRAQVAITYRGKAANAGLVTVPVTSRGRVCLSTNRSLTSLSLDLLGHYTASGIGTKSLRAVAARTVVDSRTGRGWSGRRLQSGRPRLVRIAGRADVPEDVRTVLVSLGTVNASRDATLSIAAPGTPVSLGAAVKAVAGAWRTGTIIVKLDDQGRLPLRLTNGTAHVHVEVLGWFRPQAGDRAGRYRAMKGVTVLDAAAGSLSAGDTRTVRVRGGDTDVPGAASAVVVQTLASSDDGRGFLTAKPAGSKQASRPVLAFDRRGTQRTLLVVPVGDDGKITVTARQASATASLRVVGWYS